MNDVSRSLSDVEHVDAQPAGGLHPLAYAELRRRAEQRPTQEKLGQTLWATALVHEGDRRLADGETIRRRGSRGHFYAAEAEPRRHILSDRDRDKGRLERGGRRRHDLNLDEPSHDEASSDDQIDLDDAPTRPAVVDHGVAALLELSAFAGLTPGQAARALGIARRTAHSDRAWTAAGGLSSSVPPTKGAKAELARGTRPPSGGMANTAARRSFPGAPRRIRGGWQ